MAESLWRWLEVRVHRFYSLLPLLSYHTRGIDPRTVEDAFRVLPIHVVAVLGDDLECFLRGLHSSEDGPTYLCRSIRCDAMRCDASQTSCSPVGYRNPVEAVEILFCRRGPRLNVTSARGISSDCLRTNREHLCLRREKSVCRICRYWACAQPRWISPPESYRQQGFADLRRQLQMVLRRGPSRTEPEPTCLHAA